MPTVVKERQEAHLNYNNPKQRPEMGADHCPLLLYSQPAIHREKEKDRQPVWRSVREAFKIIAEKS